MEQLNQKQIQKLSEYSGLTPEAINQQSTYRNRLYLAYYVSVLKNPEVKLAMDPDRIDKLFPQKTR